VRAAEKAAANLHAVANHSAVAMFTNRRNRLNRTLEAIECVSRPGCYQLESLVVLVTTNFAFRLGVCGITPSWRRLIVPIKA